MSKVYVVGIGPGRYEKMTIEAAQVLGSCDVIAGYTVYTDLVRDRFPDKEYITTPMRQEKERCLLALRAAADGRSVAMICSGDAGVYGMAGLMFELDEDFPGVEIEVVPGVTAAVSGGALLGAPIGHDFCVISLSDLLTDRETIEARLRAAAEADFAIALYNPGSRKRPDHLRWACGILLETKAARTVCGIARNIGREGESFRITDLGKLKEESVDMFTTVFIGSSATEVIGGRMVTPRGYER